MQLHYAHLFISKAHEILYAAKLLPDLMKRKIFKDLENDRVSAAEEFCHNSKWSINVYVCTPSNTENLAPGRP